MYEFVSHLGQILVQICDFGYDCRNGHGEWYNNEGDVLVIPIDIGRYNEICLRPA